MEKIIGGLKVDIRPHETWLHFESTKGNSCSFCGENKFPSICASAISEWVQDRLREQEKNRKKLLIKELEKLV